MDMTRLLALAFALSLGHLGSAQDLESSWVGHRIEDGDLLARLQSGGLVLVFRHGRTGEDPEGPSAVSPRDTFSSVSEQQAAHFDCARQRNLSNEGRGELREAAGAIRRVGMVVNEVLSSPMCRTRETAWLLFGQATPSDALLSAESLERQALLGTVPADGGNRVLVTHSSVVRGIIRQPGNAADELTPEGHGFVLEPHGNGEYDVLARLGPDDWLRLADLAR